MEATEFAEPTISEVGSIAGLTAGGGPVPVADGTWHQDPNNPDNVIIDGSPKS